ncbi:MAG: MarR family winged helix-turn-helix transcriptional regulator [Planctomycetota bacterium]
MDEVSEDAVTAIQQLYPQIYHACHRAHTRRRSNAFAVSETDSAILAHIGPGYATTARDLARHLGVGAPTMSAALQRLERLGYVARAAASARQRTRPLSLTERGRLALQAGSVLDADRLRALLGALSPRERTRAVQGLALLARGARSMPQKGRSARVPAGGRR